MKNKGKMRLFAAFLAVMLCMAAFPLTAFAGGGPEYEEPLPEEQPEETTGGYEPQPLTPEGNMSLVDDIESEASGNKQFITVVTKNGNYFYIIIDRAADGENTVHFLNQVDEADLMALMDEAVKPHEPVVTPKPEPIDEPQPEPEPEKNNGTGGILVILLVLALAGGVFYYFKVMKPKQSAKGSSNLEDYDFEDDEEEYETEIIDLEQEDTE